VQAEEWLRTNGHLLEVAWERLFVEAVLSKVEGLDFEHVRAQVPFTDGSGRERRLDFAIVDDRGAKLAIEVMGLQATPVMQRDFTNDSRKAIALVTNGWVYLPLANAVFGRPGPGGQLIERIDGARRCAKAIRATLHSMRSARAAEVLNDSFRARIAETEADIQALKRQRADATAAKARAEAEAERLRASHVSAPELEAIERRIADTNRLLDELNAGLSEASNALAAMQSVQAPSGPTVGTPEPAPSPTRLRPVFFAAVALAAAASAVGGGAIALKMSRDRDPPKPTPAASTISSTMAVSCEGTIGWGDAVSCPGRSLTVKGPVAGISYQKNVTGGPTFVNLGNDFPSAIRFQVVIWERCRSNFTVPPETAYGGKVLYVTGGVEVHGGVPQMEVCFPAQVTVE